MTDDEERETCVKFLENVKAKGKAYSGFEDSLNVLHNYAALKGLENEVIDLLANVIMSTDLGATRLVSLVKCLIPRRNVPEHVAKSIINWCLSSINELPITVSIIVIQWIIGIWDHQLVDRKIINTYYSVFFYAMLKKEKLEKHIARLIYVLTKPEDVTRREVSRLLTLHQKYSKTQKHIVVLLSLFKSYKPELVPEKIISVNIESVWKPIPEVLREMLQDAKVRLEIQQTEDIYEKGFKWNTLEIGRTRKAVAPLLPSVGYFQIGSSIFKEKDTKSIFDISSLDELGKWHLSVELPCNAVSMLSNTAGYHLLTFADFQYQSRFSYNLYNTLMRAFMLENEKFSTEQINKLLDMTAEFSRYMQQGILVVNRFLDEYLYFNTGEYQSKLLTLLQWMISVSIDDVQENILVHVQNIFYESTLTMKCEIIRTLKMLIINLFVNQGFEECFQKTPAPFLGQGPVDKLEDVIPVLAKICEGLIVSGLNIHAYDVLLLSEALSFYEEIYILENRSTLLSFTLAPPAVIYGGFVAKNCAILSRTCKLLLRYRDISLKLKTRNAQNRFKKQIYTISVYAQDLVGALWYDEPFKNRHKMYFLRNIPEKVVEDLEHCNLDYLLNISNHFAILPYKCVLSKAGLNINTKEDAMSIALHYYSAVNEFLGIFQS